MELFGRITADAPVVCNVQFANCPYYSIPPAQTFDKSLKTQDCRDYLSAITGFKEADIFQYSACAKPFIHLFVMSLID